MVKAGESSGNLDVVLARLTEFLENQMELRGKVISAMIYPLLMTVVGAGILAFLFAFVIPKVTAIFEEQERALPAITRILLFISDVISGGWFIILPLLIGGTWGSFAGASPRRASPSGTASCCASRSSTASSA